MLTKEILDKLEWKRFETLCSEFLDMMGFQAKETNYGPDGGVDIVVYKGSDEPCGIVQCKAWHTVKVGERYIRDLLGVMAKGSYKQGMFMTTGDYTSSAREFANGVKITLVTGDMLIKKINQLPDFKLNKLLDKVLDGDYWTPTCPKCGIKMVARTAKKGKNEGQTFWGCKNFPKCRHYLMYKEIEHEEVIELDISERVRK